mmetsp:Transcript_57228/g.64873  ORF Transcript_57228/g.64873 Transcript_57228/m.64873 type:complete len:164 (-) Transcript_57228:303-794(-)
MTSYSASPINYLAFLIITTFLCLSSVSSFSQSSSNFIGSSASRNQINSRPQNESKLNMVFVMPEPNVLAGAAVGFGGFAVGIGMVTFAESQGERSVARGVGLGENMATQLSGGLMEDVEMSSIEDLGSLTSQLENALKESGGSVIEMSEDEKKRIAEDLETGW